MESKKGDLMILNYFSERFALTQEGSKNLIKGIIYTTLLNISFILPVGLYAFLIYIWVNPLMGGEYIVPNLKLFIFLILVVLGVMFVFGWKQYHFVFNTTYAESEKRRIDLAEHLRKLPLSFFENRDLADLTSTIMNDCTDLEHVFSHAIPQLFGSMISLCFVAVGLIIFDWRLAIALLWVVPIAFIILYMSKNYSQKSGKIIINDSIKSGDAIQECLDSIRDLKSYNYELEYLSKLETLSSNLEKSRIKTELKMAIGVISGNMILKIGIVSVILLGSYLIVNNQISIYTLLIFLIASATIYTPVENSLMNLAEINIMDLKIDRNKEIKKHNILTGTTDYSLDNYDIEFNDVNFNYDGLKNVLENINFIAKQGEVTALVGASGGGKSTVSKLAARFWDPVSGEVKLGNQNLAEVDAEKLLENFSIVFQDVILFNDTIMENIRIGKQNASDEEVIKAAELAECGEFVKNLSMGYDTVIGENGELLSGGQRQRISIARALLKDANVILLDEATSFLDVENESKIQKAISALIKNKTVIIIAHRMRTIANADQIIVLADGKIIEHGTPGELLNQDTLFKQMVDLQNLSENWKI